MRIIVCILAAFMLLPPASTLAQDSGDDIGGFLSRHDARTFIQRQLPDAAPALLLKDKRAKFYTTQRLRVQPARGCHRKNKSQVSCRYRLRLDPDAAHREANWWPIHCRGAILVTHLRDGALGGTLDYYTCRSKQPAKT